MAFGYGVGADASRRKGWATAPNHAKDRRTITVETLAVIRTIAFWSALIAYVLLAIMVVAGGAAWPGYSHVSQFISELGATGAPHGRLVSLGGFLPIGLALTLFAVLAIFIEPRGVLRTLGFLGIVMFASGYTVAAFYPCDFGCRPETPSPSQIIHNTAGLFGYLVAAPSLLALAVSSRKWPNAKTLFPLGVVGAVIAGVGFLTIGSPIAGLGQRALEGAVAVWILTYAFSLRRPA